MIYGRDLPRETDAPARPAPFRPPAADAGEAADIWSRLGVEVQDLPEDVAKEMSLPSGGVIVTNVQPGSPAAMAGLERRDVITAAGDEVVKNKAELVAVLEKLAGDEGAVLLVERKGKQTYAILKK